MQSTPIESLLLSLRSLFALFLGRTRSSSFRISSWIPAIPQAKAMPRKRLLATRHGSRHAFFGKIGPHARMRSRRTQGNAQNRLPCYQIGACHQRCWTLLVDAVRHVMVLGVRSQVTTASKDTHCYHVGVRRARERVDRSFSPLASDDGQHGWMSKRVMALVPCLSRRAANTPGSASQLQVQWMHTKFI